MRRWGEYGFDAAYLAAVFVLAAVLLRTGSPVGVLFGWMALTLGAGDLLHLAPRMHTLRTGQACPRALGAGRLATSVTATVWYLLLYRVCELWYGVQPAFLSRTLLSLAVLRLILLVLPANRWLSGEPAPRPLVLLRNLPFAAIGLAVAARFLLETQKSGDRTFVLLPLAVVLSFVLYAFTVLLSPKRPAAGMLMIPKTLLYLWVEVMGLFAVL